jgi:succinoglycan biosynthesis protein ExoA
MFRSSCGRSGWCWRDVSELVWPSVSVVIPALDEEQHIEAALASVLAQDYPGCLDICVALGPSTDRTNEIVQRSGARDRRISTVDNPSGGRCSGLNAAIRATDGEVVVRVDARSVLPAGYVKRAVSTLQRTGAANVGGVQRAVGDSPFTDAVAAALSSPFGMGGAKFHTGGSEGPEDTVFLGTFRRDWLERVGLFDETLVGNEDYELNIRLRRAGGVVWFDPSLSVDYVPRSSLASLARQFANYGAWKRRVARLHPTSLKLRQMVPPIAVLALIAALAATPWQPIMLVIPTVYLMAIAVAAAVTNLRMENARTSRFARLLLIFPTMHLSWGLGFLVGRGRARR